jgi:hypothetical protein
MAVLGLAVHEAGTGDHTIMEEIAAQRRGLPVQSFAEFMGNSYLLIAPVSGSLISSASAHRPCILPA